MKHQLKHWKTAQTNETEEKLLTVGVHLPTPINDGVSELDLDTSAQLQCWRGAITACTVVQAVV